MTSRVTPLRLLSMLRSLAEAEIEFLIFGAVAGVLHGHFRGTRDLDIIVEPSAANIDRVIAWLHSENARLGNNPARGIRARDERALHMGSNAFVTTGYGELDIVRHLPGLAPWADLSRRAVEIEFEGLTLRVVDLATLIERKRARSSPQDLLDIEALEAISARSSPGP